MLALARNVGELHVHLLLLSFETFLRRHIINVSFFLLFNLQVFYSVSDMFISFELTCTCFLFSRLSM